MMLPVIKSSDLVYISGPMTGIADANRAAFDAAEKFLREKYGCGVLNPARMPDGLQYRQYMAHAMQLLAHATVMVLLPGWERSRGAFIEVMIAERDGVPAFELESAGANHATVQ